MSEVLDQVNYLCEVLKGNYQLQKQHSHIASIQKGVDVEHHQKMLDKIENGEYDFKMEFEIQEGRKYYKVVKIVHGNPSVHCFVDKKTGEVYKAASWAAPAKGVRYNLLSIQSRTVCFQRAEWSGGYLYTL